MKNKTTTIRMPESLYKEIAKMAKRNNRSINAQMVYILQLSTLGLGVESHTITKSK